MIREGVRAKLVAALAIGLALVASSATAASSGAVEEAYVYFSPQYFSWQEYFNGSRILMEEGALFGVGGGAKFSLYRKRLMLKVQGEIFGGDVHYRGETQQNANQAISQLPVKTSVVYFGSKLDTDIGWRLEHAEWGVEPFTGLGYRWWFRSLEDSTTVDANGNQVAVAGYTEFWQTLYARVGTRGSYSPAANVAFFAEVGGKYPFLNRNSADPLGTGTVTVEPEPRWSLFSEIGVRYGKLRTSLFYEGFRFGQSPSVSAGPGVALLQPKTDSDIYGMTIGWAFK